MREQVSDVPPSPPGGEKDTHSMDGHPQASEPDARDHGTAVQAPITGESHSGEPSPEKLQRVVVSALKEGLRAEDLAGLREYLSLSDDQDELSVQFHVLEQVRALESDDDRRDILDTEQRAVPDTSNVGGTDETREADVSYLGRLNVQHMADETQSLVAVMQAGDLHQRRAAVRRLTEVLKETRSVKSKDLRRAVGAIIECRDVEIAYELAQARALLSGPVGRRVHQEEEHFRSICVRVELGVAGYWEGTSLREPVLGLAADDRALLLLRMRDAPDTIAVHVCALVESSSLLTYEARLSLVESLRYCGDPRLVPSLATLLSDKDEDLVRAAVKSLGRIEDPRVVDILRTGYPGVVRDRVRAAYAGALGMWRVRTGRPFLVDMLDRSSGALLQDVVEALAHAGTQEDAPKLMEFLETEEAPLALSAIRTIGALADGRALKPMRRLHAQSKTSSGKATIEEAIAAITSRMELRGEEPGMVEPAEEVDEVEPEPFGVRAHWDVFVGHCYLLFGMTQRALRRYQSAAARRPRWAAPWMSVAFVHIRAHRLGAALAAIRRAVEENRREVERSLIAITTTARTFLRRAEELQSEGRMDVAQGLVAEVQTLDLRSAPGALRVALARKQEELRRQTA